MTAKDRIDREREFHNTRFAEGDNRDAQLEYYAAISGCFEHYNARLDELVRCADVLEYGCARGDNCLKFASVAKSMTGIDISDVAVAHGADEAAKRGIQNVHLFAMNAEQMNFPDNAFDVIFGSGILHHLNYEKAMSELHCVLRPGGAVLFMEPLGHNPLIEAYRKVTPEARTPDEHPLLRSDFKSFEKTFPKPEFGLYGLSTLMMAPFRNSPVRKPLYSVLRAVDRVLLALPGQRWWAWYAVMEGRKSVKAR